jgi:hypothetical protein
MPPQKMVMQVWTDGKIVHDWREPDGNDHEITNAMRKVLGTAKVKEITVELWSGTTAHFKMVAA